MIQNISHLYMLSQRFRVKEQVATMYGGSSGADKPQVLKSPVPLALMERCSKEGCVPFAFPLYWMSMRRAMHRGNKHSRIKHPAVQWLARSFKGARKCHLPLPGLGSAGAMECCAQSGSAHLLAESRTYCGGRNIIFLYPRSSSGWTINQMNKARI